MKRSFKLMMAILAIAFLAACNKDENQVIYEGGTAPTLTASVSGTIPLTFANSNQEAIKFTWTNPEYRLNTGVSSQNVNYQIEIDTVGANFTNPKKKIVTVSNELMKSFTVGELNGYLLNDMELMDSIPHNIEIRVRSSIGASNAVPLYSNKLTFTVTPFAIPPKVQPYGPDVYVIGDATPNGWPNPITVPGNQKMTQTGPLTYEITMQLVGSGGYLFLPVNGSWAQKYGFDGANLSNNPDGGDFIREGGDIRPPAVAGMYKIELNFQTGKFKVTKI